MSVLQGWMMSWSAGWVGRALGWTLLHFCWQGLGVAAGLWCGLRLADGRRSRVRYGLACGALALMVALPVGTFVRLAGEARAARRAPVVLAMTVDVMDAGGAGDETMRERVTREAGRALDWAAGWVPMVWVVGVAGFALRLNLGLVGAARMRRMGTGAAPEELVQVLGEVAERLGVRRVVRLAQSAVVEAPVVIGWLRPVVLMPVGCLAGLSTVQVEALLAHELAHIRRHDYLVSVAQGVVEALLFYHPAVWWVSGQMRRERECCCDAEAVAAVGGSGLEYAKALGLLEARRAAMPGLVLGANGGVLTMRIRRILGVRESAAGGQVAAVVVLAGMLAVGFAVSAAARAESQKAAGPAVGRIGGQGPDGHAMAASADVLKQKIEVTQKTLTFLEEQLKAPTPYDDGKLPNPDHIRAKIAQGQEWLRQQKSELAWLEAANTPEGGASLIRQAGSATGDAPLSRVYEMWLTQDVVWIVTPEERAAFLRLANDDERDTFIQQFWSQRDKAGAGSARDEHYRRIAYANGHFAEGNVPGWKTQRGHLYIAYGKPDSIESHPSGDGAGGAPWEVWYYSGAGGGPFGGYVPVRIGIGLPAADPARGVPVAVAVPPTVRLDGANGVDGPLFERRRTTLAVRGANAPGSQTMWTVKDGAGAPLLARTEAAALPPAEEPAAVPEVSAVPAPSPVRVSGGLMAGSIVTKVDPVYPAEAKASGVQGTVVLKAVIGKDGTVQMLVAVSGPKELQASALDAVKQWVYKPYLLNGQPTEVSTTVTVNYTIGGGLASQAPQAGGEEYAGMVVKKLGPGIRPPQLIFQVDPRYTEEARAAKISGNVLLTLAVDEQGTPVGVRVVRGIGNGLDAKAVEAVRQYKFKPAREDGKAVAVELNIEVNFKVF